MGVDARKLISEQFLSDAPGCGNRVHQSVLDGHYQKSIIAANRSKDDTLTQNDREFIYHALCHYADMLVEKNFWHLAHLSKERSLHEIDPHLANAIYRACLDVDELKSILYFDSANSQT
jgi:hypothetical protein